MIRTPLPMKPSPPLSRVSTLGLVTALQMVVALGFLGCSAADEDPHSRPDSRAGAGESSEPLETPLGPGTFPLTIKDASGSSLVFQSPPTRIVSLVPSATRTLQALGAQRLLVGRTEYDTGSALAYLPSVGRGLEPSLETLVALKPDLVIRFAGESDPSTPSRLDDLGVRHLAIRLDRIADVRTLFGDLGALTGSEGRAEKLVAEMDSTLHEIQQRVKGRPLVRVAYILGGNPPLVAGPGTFIDELLTAAGGENVFSDLHALYGPVSPEEFLVREVDLFLAPEGGEIFLPSIRRALVRVSPGLELPGPDLAQAAWHLAGLLHPTVFR